MKQEFRILIVEDDDKIFNILKHKLIAEHYKIWRATTGKEAIKLAKDIYFATVIAEFFLSDMKGVDLIKAINKINYKVNVIILTAYSFISSAVKALKAGAFAYLTKPLNIEEVGLIVKRAVENYCLLIQASKKKYYQGMSILDGLTAVYNHRYFYQRLDWQIVHLQRFPQAFSLFMIDIDNFKKYNDTMGHQAGDKILYDTAQLMLTVFRNTDLVFRYGGEEFAVILPETILQHAKIVAERLIAAVRRELMVTISVGVATFSDSAKMKNDLINQADKALYRAKRLGKNRFCVYDPKLDKTEDGKTEDGRQSIIEAEPR